MKIHMHIVTIILWSTTMKSPFNFILHSNLLSINLPDNIGNSKVAQNYILLPVFNSKEVNSLKKLQIDNDIHSAEHVTIFCLLQ
jgi:hypothetical protein